MKLQKHQINLRSHLDVLGIAAALALSQPAAALAQAPPMDKATHDAHVAAGAMPGMPTTAPAGAATGAPAGAMSSDQVNALRAKTAKVQADLKQRQAGGAMAGMKDDTMPMGGGKMAMDMPMDKPMADPAMPPPAGGAMPGGTPPMAPGKPMMDDDKMPMGMMGDDMMGMPPAAAAPAMRSGLPGFPGASHLYHIGGTGFFLDHAEHIVLTVPQQAALNAAKEKALLDQASAQRDIDAGEQALWMLTAAGQPDLEQIEKQIRAVEKSRGEQRLAFIRAVGEAATLLTEPQRQALLGMTPRQAAPAAPMTMPPSAAPAAPAPAAPAAPAMPPAGGMGDM